jgi:DNA modification methylase
MTVTIHQGDVMDLLRGLPDESVNCVVTSPPYWGLRDYGVAGQIGLEPTMQEHIVALVGVFREVRRVLRKDGTFWLNYGDAYAGSWGAQSRDHAGKDAPNPSKLSANQIRAAQQRTGTGSVSRTPGLKPKDRMLLPARVAIALCDDGWWLRDEIIWHKPNPMPSSVRDRTTPAHEMIYLLTKSARYHYDVEAIREPRVSDEDAKTFRGGSYVGGEPGKRTITGNKKIKIPGGWDLGSGGHGTINRSGRTSAKYKELDVAAATNANTARRVEGFNDRWDAGECESDGKRNKRSVWTVAPAPFKEAHFATFPPKLIEPCILAGCPVGGTVLDPFFGAGTTGLVAQQHGRNCIGIELNPEYVAIAERRLGRQKPDLADLLA